MKRNFITNKEIQKNVTHIALSSGSGK